MAGVTPRRLGARASLGKRGALGGVTSGQRGLGLRPVGSDAEGVTWRWRTGGTARRDRAQHADNVAARALAFRRRSILVTRV
jgi:hypothetical protein